ncbi:hypothetical protein N7G274_000720 [Stereocaulon virgatum]|uniref:Uncharacterized protein n=1 Tax=Stereocaulon virgatum TaxID=373712 RepID=A0ABR4AW10_9LECA
MTSLQGGKGKPVSRAEVFTDIFTSPQQRSGHGIMNPSSTPPRSIVRLVHTTAVRVLSTLATRDPTLTKPASQLKLWGIGLFEDGPLDLDEVLSNQKVIFTPMRDCILQFLVTILAHGEQLCNALYAGDDSVRALEEEIAVIFELEDLVNKVVEGRQDVEDGPNDASEIAAVVQRLFALSPSIRRARNQQSLQIREDPKERMGGDSIERGNRTNFSSMETLIGKLYQRLEAVAEIIRNFDKAAADGAKDAHMYSPAFDTERKRLEHFYDVRCKTWSLHKIGKSVSKLENDELRLASALYDFIGHSKEGLAIEQINAVISLVGDTATKIMRRDPLQPLQLYHGGIIVDAIGSRTTAEMKSRGKARAIDTSRDAVRQQ